jgi:undecaprenyl-phosphate galactose phosphotransferase
MTIVPAVEATKKYQRLRRSDRFWQRAAIASGLMISDLVSFAIADLLLRQFEATPGIALFRGGVPGQADPMIDLVAILAIVFVVSRYLAGDYTRRYLFWDGARITTGALLICGAIYLGAFFLLKSAGLWIPLLMWMLLIAGLPSARQATRLIMGRLGLWFLPTMIIGTSARACEVYLVLSKQLSLGLEVRWVLPENPERVVPAPLSSLKQIYATPECLIETLMDIGCSQVILVPDDNLPMNQAQLVDQMVGADIGVSIMPSLRRLPLFGMRANHFFGKDLLLLQVRNNLARLPQRILKRAMDLVGCITALVLLLPLLFTVAYLISREDGGPVFFGQNRVGRGGKEFRCWKFRTMVVDAEAQMARWEQENPVLLARYRESNFKLRADPRVTRIGSWLRRTSIDEFPQLFNVLLGQMSLVGPRPLLPRELPDYGLVINLYERVRPGITGLWQISGRSHTTFAERVSYDEWYIKNWTVWYDLVIMLQTAWVLLRGEGAY